MDFKFYWTCILILFILACLMFEKVCWSLFQEHSWNILWWWIKKGSFKLPVIFLLFTGTVFFHFSADWSYNLYISYAGKPESYVFLGDKLREGFFVYKENDPAKKQIFIPTLFDTNQYPRSNFDDLYRRKWLLQNPSSGDLIQIDSLNTVRLILFLILQITLIVFGTIGIVLLLKSYAIEHQTLNASFQILRPDANIEQMIKILTEKFSREIKIFMVGLLIFYIAGLSFIKFNIRETTNDHERVMPLPDFIKTGEKIHGKILKSESFSIEKKTNAKNYYYFKRYLIEFDKDFNPPVFLNLTLSKDDPQVVELDKKEKDSSAAEFRIDEDLAIE